MSNYTNDGSPNLNEASSNLASEAKVTARDYTKTQSVTIQRDNGLVVVHGIPMTREQFKAEFGKDAPPSLMGEGAPNVRMDGDEMRAVATQAEPKIDSEADHLTDREVSSQNAFNTVTAQTEYTLGWDKATTLEFSKDYMNGEISNDDPLWQEFADKGMRPGHVNAMKNAIQNSQQSVAKSELGEADYAELGRLAEQNKTIKNLVVTHALNRAGGKNRVSYKDVLNLARQYAGR